MAAAQPNGTAPKKTDWPTVILVIITGLGNFSVSVTNSTQRQADAVHAFHQIDTLHSSLDEFESRQKAELDSLDTSLRQQATMLRNQTNILSELKSLPRVAPSPSSH